MSSIDFFDLFENEAGHFPDQELEQISATLGVDPTALIAAIREIALLEALENELRACSSASISGEDLHLVRQDGSRLHVIAGGRILLDSVIVEAEDALLASAAG